MAELDSKRTLTGTFFYIMCSVWPHPHPYTNVWPEGGVVVLHVKECLQTCCFVVFIVVSYHTHIQSFSFITCPISQLCAQICPYYNVWPGAVYCCSITRVLRLQTGSVKQVL